MPNRYPRRSVQRALRHLVERGLVVKEGGPHTRVKYRRRKRRVLDPGPMGANRLFGRKWEGYD